MKERALLRRGGRRGFTLAELLAVIAILLILIGLGIPGFLSLRANIQINKYDDLAREIYVAAQNQLTRMAANGMDSNAQNTLTDEAASFPDAQPEDYDPEQGGEWKAANYRHAAQGVDAMELLLPLGAISDDVRSNGYYVIEYNVQNRIIYGVFYSEEPFNYEEVSVAPSFRTSRAVRKAADPMVGYYGGSAAARDSFTHCPAPELELINENVLKLNIQDVPDDVTVAVKVSDGTTEVGVSTANIIPKVGEGRYEVLLDSLVTGQHFHELFPTLTPGKDLKITVTYSKDGCVSASSTISGNSLFATREKSEDPDQDVVTLAWARHLQNLENSVSGLDDPAIVTARQTDHIQWKEEFGNFVSISNDGKNINLNRFEGHQLEIRDLKGTNGLFAITKEGMQLSGIRLVNPIIQADADDTSPVGALVGTAASGTNIYKCGVYCNKLKDGQAVDYDAYPNYYVDGGHAVTGGLVGKATNTKVDLSFAALPSLKGDSGASLIGAATGCTIDNSYANCDNLKAGFAYFLNGSSNTVKHCYAIGNVEDAQEADFCAAAGNTVTDCYFAVSHCKYAENAGEENKDLAPTQFSYKGTDATADWTEINQEQMKNATQGTGWAATGNWYNMIAPLTHPYRESLEGIAFPYPAIGELDHYGSWPESDGTVEVTIDMTLLGNEAAGYALSAGQVVVTDQDGKKLFDSEDHRNADGNFDGQNTIQVKPNTEITVTIGTKQGYEYVRTTIDGVRVENETAIENTKQFNYTVPKKTEMIVTFRQNAFQLTGIPAVNEHGHSINNSSYDIDLTSPNKTLKITNAKQTESVDTGSMVYVRPSIPDTYVSSVVWYTPAGQNDEDDRIYLTQKADGSYSFEMPAEATDVHVMYTTKEVFFDIEYYLMGTDGEYPQNPTQFANYKCGLGSQINLEMIKAMAESSGLPLMIDGEWVRYLEEATVTGKNHKPVFSCELDENGNVETSSVPHITKEGDALETNPFVVKIYIARREYTVTLTADEHVSGVRFGSANAYQRTATQKFRYGANVTAQAEVAPGYHFTYWDPQDTRFMMSANEEYTFEMPQFDLNLKAIAATDRHLVTINLLENDESWLFRDESRQKDPITLTLVNSRDTSKSYRMQVLTEDTISYAMQAVVPSIPEYEAGYWVQVEYESGLKTWLYTNGAETNEKNEKLLLQVRDKAVEADAYFYSVTYFPNKPHTIGSVPKARTLPKYYHYQVEGNAGLLHDAENPGEIFSGWKDYFAEGTGSDTIYIGNEILMLTRRTDMFAQWKSADMIKVLYHAGEADGGTLPVDPNQYGSTETVRIQWGSLTRKGYQFIGWSRTANAETPDFTKDGQEYALNGSTLNLYPVWQQENYTIEFYDTEGRLLTDDDFIFSNKHYGETITAPNLTVEEDTQILGWSLTKGGEITYRPGETIIITGSCKLYACEPVVPITITYKSSDGNTEYSTAKFERDVPGYLTYVPTTGAVTAWSTVPNGKGTLYFCREDGRSEKTAVFAANTTLYAVTGKVYNYNVQEWFNTLYDAVRSNQTLSGHTLIVYRDTEEPHNVWFNKSLNILASGNRTVKWKDGATVDSGDHHRLDDTMKETGELVGCMSVSNVTVRFGKSDISNLSMKGSTLTFDANEQSRVISLGNKATFHMYDGVTLTNGKRVKGENENPAENSDSAAADETQRSYYGGGVYAGLESVFYMHGGTISYCSAYKGGGVYLFADKGKSTPGSKMYMGDMVTPTDYSATAIYYTKGADGFYVNAQEKVTPANYKKYFVTAGNPEICYNTSTRKLERQNDNDWSYNDGGGGLLMLDLKDGDLVLYKGRIHNNTAYANGGGIVTDGGDTNKGDGLGNKAKLRIYEVDIAHNTAHGYGGGIFQWQGIVYVYNSTLRQNRAEKSGGGIYLHHYGDENSSIEFHYGDIADNTAKEKGGGVYVEDYPLKLTITHGNLVRNTASQEGGGAYVKGGGKFILEGGTVADNVANGSGGGVWSVGEVHISGGTLSGNRSEDCGGGVYTMGTTTLSGGTICDNSAKYLGGGIMVGSSIYPFEFSSGHLYGNTDTDYPDKREDEDNVHPGPNDIYLAENMVITIPRGGIHLSGEQRVAVDCDNDGSLRFPGTKLPRRFAEYVNESDFHERDVLYFTYDGTCSNLTVMKQLDQSLSEKQLGLYFAEGASNGKSMVAFNLNYPECAPCTPKEMDVGTELNLNTEVPNAKREGYYLAGWARTPDALEEQYVLYYDVVENVWRSGYTPGTGWTEKNEQPMYTVQDLSSQTLYAMWRPCVVVYEVGQEAKAHGVTIQPTSFGPTVTLLNPEPVEYEEDGKTYRFQYWVEEGSTDKTHLPMERLTLTENLRLKAVWQPRTADTFIITFHFNDGTSDQTGELRREVVVNKDENYTVDFEVHQAYKIFKEWNTSPDGSGETKYHKGDTISKVENDLDLYAIWVDAVTLTYNVNGGEGSGKVVSLEKGNSINIDDFTPTRAGYRFLGWATTPDAAEAEYPQGGSYGPLNENAILYAVWHKIAITFNLNYEGAGEPKIITPEKGEYKIDFTTLPTREGYDFLGWAKDAKATEPEYTDGNSSITLSEDITLYAVWKEKPTTEPDPPTPTTEEPAKAEGVPVEPKKEETLDEVTESN